MDRARIDMRRNTMMETIPALDVEHARLITEAYAKYSNYPPVLRRAYAFAYVLDNMKPNMQEGELIVGSLTGKVRGMPIFPEFVQCMQYMYRRGSLRV